MNQHSRLKLSSALITSLVLVDCLTGTIIPLHSVLAQDIKLDGTLGPGFELSESNDEYTILEEYGQVVDDTNLFHSFDYFNLDSRQTATFESADSIRNIFSRVTGGSPSSIDGTIATTMESDVNLFLINPDGIIFGDNSALKVSGSFTASTADAILFGDNYAFSASEGNVLPNSLLTVDPSALLFNQINDQSARIINTGTLQVRSGTSLLLVGGDITLNNGNLSAPGGGRIDLASIASSGTIDLIIRDDIGLALGAIANIQKGNIELISNSEIVSNAPLTEDTPGTISLQANTVSLSENSFIKSQTIANPFFPSLEFGDASFISIQADGQVILDNNSQILSTSDIGSRGNSGNIEIITGSLFLKNGSEIEVATNAFGDAGQILLIADNDIHLEDSFIIGESGRLALGINDAARDIRIDAGGELSLTGFSVVSTQTVGIADAGNITVNAEQLNIQNGSRILASTEGPGKGGDIEVTVNDSVDISGIFTDTDVTSSIFSSGLFTTTSSTGGDAGNINLRANHARISDSAVLSARTNSSAAGGDISVNVNSLKIKDGGQVLTTAFSDGNAGSIEIQATENIILSGTDPNFAEREELFGTINIDNDGPASGLLARTEGSGLGGEIIIHSPQLTILDGAVVSTSASSNSLSESGGNIQLNTTQLALSGAGTGLFAETLGSAQAGSIILKPHANGQSLTVSFQDHAAISASTRDDGKNGQGGNVTAIASEIITLTGEGRLSAQSAQNSSGAAGDITLRTNGQLVVRDGMRVEVSSDGAGDSGQLEAIANSIRLDNGQLLASTQAGEGGNITLQVEDVLILDNESLISARASNEADGGNVGIKTEFLIALPPEGPNGNDIIANAENGDGGRIEIQATQVFGIEEIEADADPQNNQSNDLDASSEAGINGEVIIQTLDVDPEPGVNELPTGLVTPELSQGCQVSGDNGSGQFISTGRGGLTHNPYEPLSSDGIEGDIYPAAQTIASSHSVDASETSTQALVEAQELIRTSEGRLMLTVETPRFSSRNSC